MGKKQYEGAAVLYGRYSSHNQRDVSIEQQFEACEKYAEGTGLQIVARYADRAISGRTDNRPQFQKMMQDAHKGEFDYVLAWKSNRLGRNMLQALVNESKLADLGVKVLYVEEDFDDTAAGRFALRSMMNVNEFYSEAMAEDIKRGLMDNAAKCKVNGKLPLGYKRGPDGSYAIDEDAAAIVQEIYQRVIDGWGLTEIMSDLNRRGVKTATGAPWRLQSFDKLLQNEQYTGVYKYSSVRTEGGIPVIIEKKDFDKVQKILLHKKNPRGKQRRNAEYLLSGKVFCGKCGSPMGAQCGTARDGTKRGYYMCNRRRYEHACDKKNVRQVDLEQAVCNAIRAEIMNDKVIDQIISGYSVVYEDAMDQTKRNALQADLDDVNARLKNILNAVEAGIFNDTTQQRMLELNEARRDIEEAIRLDEEANDFPTPDEVRFNLLELRKGDLDDATYMRDLVNTFVNAIFVYDDYLRIRFNYGKEKRFSQDGKALDNEPSAETTDRVGWFTKCELSPTKVLSHEPFYMWITLRL
ncbi:MAG: recombinase family protein [Oscillospiraceae bacterium]|nr:recombinase family protein [Oscillospiraceae bacterium]